MLLEIPWSGELRCCDFLVTFWPASHDRLSPERTSIRDAWPRSMLPPTCTSSAYKSCDLTLHLSQSALVAQKAMARSDFSTGQNCTWEQVVATTTC